VNPIHDKIVARICKAIFAVAATLFVLGGALIHLRLMGLDATKISLVSSQENCSQKECSAEFTFKAERRFVLLGQILRTFELTDINSRRELLPVTAVTGTNTDAWLRLRVYEVIPGRDYKITATKPSSAKLGYLIGVLPRQTDNEGILTIPQVGSAVSNIATSISLVLMVIIICASLLTAGQKLSLNGPIDMDPKSTATAAIMLTIAVTISSGLVDTLIPDGNFRNRALRTLVAAAALMFVIKKPQLLRVKNQKINLFIHSLLALAIAHGAWPLLQDSTYYALTLFVLAISGSIKFLRKNEYLAATLWASGIFDAARVLGLIQITDYPPMYLFNQFSLIALGVFAGNSGGFATIAMAGEAYRRFKRDLVLESIKETMQKAHTSDSARTIYAVQSILPSISDLLKAGRISITINLPLGRPIIQLYDRDTESHAIYDDGTIPGAVTMRTLLYGDTILFESFQEYSARLNIASSTSLGKANFFCAVPIKVNQQIVGSLMLTKLNDEILGEKAKSKDPLTVDKENIAAVVSAFEQTLSSVMVQNLNDSATISKALHKTLHEELALCDKPSDFLSIFSKSIARHCKVDVIIHAKINKQGIAVAESGICPDAWDFFCRNPLNLDTATASAVGPTIVAFLDKRSSFIKDVAEIQHRLHPKTQAVFELMDTESIAAIPLASEERTYVITLMRRRASGSADAGVVQVVESTEALFIAALEVMSQRSSVVALGELTSRLIGDPDIRKKIVDAAKARNLPTTIGSPKTSFLLLFDLAGSSELSEDTELKARAYGHFYDSVNRKSQELINGTIRKTIGDAVIITWDGTNKDPSEDPDFLSKLRILTKFADQIAQSIGCKGARAILHYGKYFLGLVGTETFGQIDVIGSGIDEVCKMESHMKTILIDGIPAKLAISDSAAEQIRSDGAMQISWENLTSLKTTPMTKMSIRYASNLNLNSQENPHVA
jgi:class 3 adenylate cyclase